MSESARPTWKQLLSDRMPEALAREIDIFETQIDLRKKSKIEERLFAETRLRRGVYGQRYDNGQRHDGEKAQQLSYPSGDITKGPSTMWDAPGMQRIKIPRGHLTAAQLEALADLCEEYSDGILHVTTRQDFQLHFVHIEDTPDLMRRLAAVGITTREACGNTVRNVTACPLAGVCRTEAFDVGPYAHAMTYFLLGHDDTQDFGRKFKVAFSGCQQEACGLANFHDVGLIAKTRVVDGQEKRGFGYYVGGGLGSVPVRRPAVRRVPARGGAAAADPGHRPGVRPPGRKGQARPGPPEVPGQEAGLPRVQAAGAGRAPGAAPRPALDRLPGRPARHRREAAAARRAGHHASTAIRRSPPGPAATCRTSASRATGW